MNKVAKYSAALVALLLMVLVVVVSEVYQAEPTSAQVVTVAVSSDFIGNNTSDANVQNSVTATITDAGRNDNALSIETIPPTEVTVTNLDTSVSINVTSTETGDNTGIFVVVFEVTEAVTTTTDPFRIAASDGDNIQVVYCFETTGTSCSAGSTAAETPSFASAITVDALGPVIGNESPADGSTSDNDDQTLQLDIGDAGVGIGTTAADVRARVTFNIRGVPSNPGPVVAIEDDDDFQWLLEKDSLNNPEGTLNWYVRARDALGNLGGTTTPFTIDIDSEEPAFVSATTGDEADTSDDPVVNSGTPDKLNSILLVFDDELDGDTVDAADFLVQINGDELEIASATAYDDLPFNVYLTLDDELASDAVPTVQITGDVRDEANNTASLGDTVTADDGIAPAVTLVLQGTAEDGIVTNGDLTIRVSADEDSTDPTRTGGQLVVNNVSSTESDLLAERVADDFSTDDASRVWEWEFNFDTDDNTEDGLYNAYVTITDGTNSGTAGHISDASDDDALIFEVDTQVGGILVAYSDDNPKTFITLGFEEADEYAGDSHDELTSVTATVDGASVVANTIDNVEYTIAPPSDGWSLGDHDLVVTATDEAGNTETFSGDDTLVTIVVRDPLSIPLRPGLNLISLPGAPASSLINDVIPADHPLNQVLSYDPSVLGGWQVAVRGDDGPFAGTLTTISSNLAYFVRTTSFEPLDVLIPRLSAGEQVLPPSVSLRQGWNLLPVLDVSGDLDAGVGIIADDYVAGLGAVRVFALDVFGRLTPVDISDDTDDEVVIGQGYWIFVAADTVLVP